MNYNVYRVEKVNDYQNKGDLLDYNYSKDFEELRKLRGYVTQDYVITDSEFELGHVYFNGDLIKPLEKVSSFEGEPIKVIPIKKSVEVKDLKLGDRFKFGKTKFVKLDNSHGGCLCLAADVLFKDCFDENNQNNWVTSSLRKKLAKVIGDYIENNDALVPFVRDLTTDDGMTEYGSCTDVVSLLTCDEYRKYRKLIPNCGKWHWTITADSLEYSCFVRIVLSDGSLSLDGAYGGNGGVRPLCVLKSDTPVETI